MYLNEFRISKFSFKTISKKFQNLFSKETCKVAVNYCIYDKRKNNII